MRKELRKMLSKEMAQKKDELEYKHATIVSICKSSDEVRDDLCAFREGYYEGQRDIWKWLMQNKVIK